MDGGEPDHLALVLNDVSQRFDAEARFDAMFRANPAPAIMVRLRDQHIIRANPGFLALTGFAPDRIEGRWLFGFDLLGAVADPQAFRARVEAGEVVAQTEAELLGADGSRRLVLFAGQPIDVTGDDALLLTFADLEPRRHAETSLAASERHLRAVFDMAPIAMTVTRDADHRFARVNAAFGRPTGHEGEAALGRTADELALWRDAGQRARCEAIVAEHGKLRETAAALSSRAGDALDCLVAAETISVQGTQCVPWVYQDVTERRRSEAELSAAIEEVLKGARWLGRSILDKLATLRRARSRSISACASGRSWT